jgi:hypothetical protein
MKISRTHLYLRVSRSQDHSAVGRIKSIKNMEDPAGNLPPPPPPISFLVHSLYTFRTSFIVVIVLACVFCRCFTTHKANIRTPTGFLFVTSLWFCPLYPLCTFTFSVLFIHCAPLHPLSSLSTVHLYILCPLYPLCTFTSSAFMSLIPLQHNTNIYASSGIQTRNPSKRAAAEPRLRPLGHWDVSNTRPSDLYRSALTDCATAYHYNPFYCMKSKRYFLLPLFI